MFGWSDEEEHDDAVPHDRFDQMSWNGMRMESISIDEMVNELSVKYDHVEDFAQDVYSLLAKGDPRVREPEEMSLSHVPLRQVTDELQDLTELKRLRTWTVGDPFNAALALGSMKEALQGSLERAAQLKGQAEAAQAARDAARQAAQEAADNPGDPGAGEAAEQASAAAQAAADHLQAGAEQQAAEGAQAMRKAVKDAREEVEEVNESAASYGLEPGEFQRMPAKERFALARRLQSEKLRKFAALIGQFRQLAAAEWRRRYNDGSDEQVGIKLGDDLTRLTGQELINMATPELEDDFWRRFVDKELWVKELRGRERVGKGPIIVVADESGSMADEGELWAKGLALALLDQAGRGKRDFHYIGFASGPLREFSFPGGKADVDKVIEMAEGFLNGGTDFARPLRRALDLAIAAGKERPDIVFITDGVAGSLPFLEEWRQVRHELSIRCYGIFVATGGYGLPSEVLEEIADDVRTIADVTNTSQVADILRG